MKQEIINVSVVVQSEQHNPSILHPSFLTSEGIVPLDWELSDAPVCTPVFARVNYKNGIAFVVENNRFQVIDTQVNNLAESDITDLGFAYCSKLPHVHYTAIGVNYEVFLENDKPEGYLKQKFLISQSADIEEISPSSIGFRFIYDLSIAKLQLSVDSGKIRNPIKGTEINGILVKANYHNDIPNNDLGEIKKVIDESPNYCKNFESLLKSILA